MTQSKDYQSKSVRERIVEIWSKNAGWPSEVVERMITEGLDEMESLVSEECQKEREALLDELLELVKQKEESKPITESGNTSTYVWARTLINWIASKRQQPKKGGTK